MEQAQNGQKYLGTVYRLTMESGAQHVVTEAEYLRDYRGHDLQPDDADPSRVVQEEQFYGARWEVDHPDEGVERWSLMANTEGGQRQAIETHIGYLYDTDEERQPLAHSGEERQEAREQTETVGRSFMDRVHDLSERIQGWVRTLGQDRSQGME